MKAIAAVAAAFIAMQGAPAPDVERITDFASSIQVSRAGGIAVTESITVNALGHQISHGIFRDFPTSYTDHSGVRSTVGFHVTSVLRDGRDVPYSIVAIPSGERVTIGDPAVELANGAHTFTLSYSTDGQIRFFQDYDELYWNVTGNAWSLAIDHAEATIDLPSGAKVTQVAAYTGPAGSTARNALARYISDTAITFKTTAPLRPAEGLTVAVGFAKGAVVPRALPALTTPQARGDAPTVAALAGVLLLAVYFVVVKFMYGCRPRRGTIIPLFRPPQDLSPAAMRFVRRRGYDRDAYAASVINMAVKGYLRINREYRPPPLISTGITRHNGTFTLTRTGKAEDEAGLAVDEAKLAYSLFSKAYSIELKQSNHRLIAKSISILKTSLKEQCEPEYLVANRDWFYVGIGILVATVFVIALLSDNGFGAGVTLLFVSGPAFLAGWLLQNAWNAWRNVLSGRRSRISIMEKAVVPTGSAIAMALFSAALASNMVKQTSLPVVLLVAAGAVLSSIFFRLLKAPTPAGAKILNEIDGFRLFLVTAEQDRLEALNPPDVTPEVFERFLPYAIALDAETEWSWRFAAATAAAAVMPGEGDGVSVGVEVNYTPDWYPDSSFHPSDAHDFARGLSDSLGSAVGDAFFGGVGGGDNGGSGGGDSGGGGGGGW
jgi:uncharacterized membrane protein YgcG